MNSKAIAALASLWLPVVASAADGDATTKLDSLSQKLEKILATQGISFGGQFRGELGASNLTGNGATAKQRDGEQIGYTSVDFDIRARPNTMTQARAVFRMHLDDASFFGSPYTPFETRWLSLDGRTSDGILYYHLGNFLQRWSPLTMWSPDPSFVYTPRVFAQQQKQAMDERFLGGNNRNLQGVNAGIRAAVPSAAIDSFDVGLTAAKLLTGAPVGSPASTFVSSFNNPGDKSVGWPDTLANFDRWVLGGRGRVTFLHGVTLAANFLQEKDLKSTYGSTDPEALSSVTTFERVNLATGQTVALDSNIVQNANADYLYQKNLCVQNGIVTSGQLGVDAAKLMSNENLILSLDGEFAYSSWDYLKSASVQGVAVDSTSDTTADHLFVTNSKTYTGRLDPHFKALTGKAVNAMLQAGWKTKDWSAKVGAGFLSVDSAYRADLAQTPVFRSSLGRIYNSEQDLYSPSTKSFSNLIHYNTFDALYHNVHHWVAESYSPQNENNKVSYDKLAYTNYVAGWATQPLGGWTAALGSAYDGWIAANANYGVFQNTGDSLKTLVFNHTAKSIDSIKLGLKSGTTAQGARSYSDSALAYRYKSLVTPSKMALYNVALNSGIDRDMELVLPGGEATPNRVGPKFSVNADVLGGGVELLATGYMLQEAKGTVVDSEEQVTAEKAKFQQMQGGVKFRLDRFVPGWNTFLNPKTPQPLEVSASFGRSTAKGGTWLNYESTELAASLYVGVLPRLALLGGYQAITGKDKTLLAVNRNESDIAGGLEYKIQEGAYFLAMYNLLSTKYPNAPEYDFDQKIWSTKISVSF